MSFTTKFISSPLVNLEIYLITKLVKDSCSYEKAFFFVCENFQFSKISNIFLRSSLERNYMHGSILIGSICKQNMQFFTSEKRIDLIYLFSFYTNIKSWMCIEQHYSI